MLRLLGGNESGASAMANEPANRFKLEVSDATLWLRGLDDRGAPVTVCLGETSRALGELALSVSKLQLSRSLYLLPRGH